ncbi:MAG: RnfABCDGE type electron transport complex subunit D [Candidatus Marinimicrobia bacterium]|nr:RnfABCDGE type electron transport complex subunit D [Candidatus Neomarinimicrobiota bacterium]
MSEQNNPTENSLGRLVLSSSPHQNSNDDVKKIMRGVVLALLPAVVFSVYYFGLRSMLVIMTAIAACLVTEFLLKKLRNKKINEGSAVVTGLLLAMTLPPSIHLGYVVLGSVFAIGIGKEIFGGLGNNIFNPALLGRAFLQASFPVKMTTWTPTKLMVLDAKTFATPLGGFKFGENIIHNFSDYWNGLIMGNIGGCIGETSAAAIALGGFYLIVKRWSDWRIPVSYLLSVFVLGGIFWLINPAQYPDPVFHLFSGGLMLGAFFMATDMVTSPETKLGSWIFGIGCGFFLVLIRLFGGLPEGVMYSILLMNAITPLINRFTQPTVFGEVVK